MLEKKVRALEREIEKQEALSAELDAKIEAAAPIIRSWHG